VDLGDKKIVLSKDEVDITAKEIKGWTIAQQDDVLVALDITLTPELRKEGIARDLVNRIQNYRKDSGLEVTDRIDLSIVKNEALQEAATAMEDYIKSETLIDNITWVDELADGTELEIDGIESRMKLVKK